MPWEPVNLNIHGDTAMQYVPAPNWRADYEAYLRDFSAQRAREAGALQQAGITCAHAGQDQAGVAPDGIARHLDELGISVREQDMRKHTKVTLAFNGKRYEVTGVYQSGIEQSATQEREPASFAIEHIAGLGGADVCEAIKDEETFAALAHACCREVEEDFAYAMQEAAERQHEMDKEKAA